MVDRGQVHTYVFGDQTYDIADTLESLSKTNDDPLVVDFIQRSCGVLKQELSHLPAQQQARCPRFATLPDLLLPYRAGTLNPALVQALTCTAQLGLFIQQHGSGGQAYPTPGNSCLVGICTGSLAAAAVSCAHSASSLLSAALHAVAVAVRLGALAWDIADRISDTSDCSFFEPWTAAIAGSSLESVTTALEQYIADAALPIITAPYISASVTSRQCSVSAPPAVLDAFLASKAGKLLTGTTTPLSLKRITAPYHASHLYSEADISHVASGVPHDDDGASHLHIPIISATANGRSLSTPSSLRVALEEAARDCLLRRIALDLLPARIAEHVRRVTQSDACNKTDVVFHDFAFSGEQNLIKAVRPLLALDPCTVRDKLSSPLSPLGSPDGSVGRASKSPIAILSASGRFPGHADSMDAFWDILHRGVDTHEMVPPSRWNSAAHVGDTATKNVSGTGFGCWLHQAGQFDVAFFNMSPREAAQVDPAQRVALLTAAEALEQAGIVPNRTPSTQKHRVGVWFGSTSNDWMETNSAQNIDTYFIPGGNRAFIPGRINYHFKFSGPSYTIDTACSSSLAALHLACNALWRGEVDTAIVGGTNVLTNPDMTAGLDRGHFLSRTGNCKTFDDNADGYCRGEAVVTVILKRLEDARLDKDPVQACILGVATNHNAEAESITRPHAAAQQELFEHLLAESNIKANDISYVEMHGTGTQAGDAGETTSVVTTLSPINTRGSCARPATSLLHIGAVKSNMGHGEAAAGVTSLAKVLLMLKHSTIPPHTGIKTKINHRLPDLQARNTRIAVAPTPWNKPASGRRRVLLNNFSAAGGNTAIILEDAPPSLTMDEPDPRRHHVITLSAKTPESLASNIRNMVNWLEGQSDREGPNFLPKLSYTTTARRMHHRHRAAVSATSTEQVVFSLKQRLDQLSSGHKSVPIPAKVPGFVYAFTGQGSAISMGADLYARFASFKADMNRYDQLCITLGFPSILPLFQQADTWEGAAPTLLQLAHVCCQMGLSRLWTSFGITPSMVVGHSLGEYAALYAAGVLTQADVIYLVGKRAQLMERHLSAGTHAMLVVMASEVKVLAALPGRLGQDYEISCRNGEHNVVLGGTRAQINDARAVLESKGMRCHHLHTPLAFHTSQVDPVLDTFYSISKGVNIRAPKIPVISPTLGRVLHHASDFGDRYFVHHCRNTVNIMTAVGVAAADGLLHEKMIAIEMGPSPVVSRMVKDIVGSSMQTFASIHKGMDTWQLLTEGLAAMYLAGANPDWSRYHEDFPQSHEVLQLPAYGWTLKEYWMQYVHDWSLRKGDAPIAPVIAQAAPRLESSSIHQIIKNNLANDHNGEIVLEVDVNRDDVRSMVQGHKVYGVPLCTPSVYADIVLMIGAYAKQIYGLDSGAMATEVGDMNIQSALVTNEVGRQQILRIAAKFDSAKNSAFCTFSSVDENGKEIEQHANCQLRFVDAERTKADLKRAALDARSSMKALHGRVGADGSTFRFSKAMIYKMIGQLADFDPKYRGLSAIVLDNDALEATGTICFKDIPDDGKWFTNPAYLDALTQTGGFVMNANEEVDLEKEVYINHGWGSLKLFATKLDPDAKYHSYVKMTEGKDKLWGGDIIIFDESDELVAVVGGVALQGVPKRLMEYVVNSAYKKVSGATKPSSQQQRSPHHPEPKPPAPVATKPTPPKAAGPGPAEKPLNTCQVVTAEQQAALESKLASQAADRTQDIAYESWSTALKILAEESGVVENDLKDDVELADIGIDSLLSLVICGRLRDEVDVDIPERDLYTECCTIADVKKRVCGVDANLTIDVNAHDDDTRSDAGTEPSGPPTPLSGFSTPALQSDDSSLDRIDTLPTPFTDVEAVEIDLSKAKKSRTPPLTASIAPAWSMYLQGSKKRSSETLFLFPDGCGAATSYLSLPELSPTTAVVGFNSPFMKTPSRMYEYSLPEVLQSYIAGLRSRQAEGPYHLGGWSAGGILAYAIAQELFAQGEKVASLTLIDSPPPNKGLDRLPDRWFEHCTKVGLFGTEMQRGAEPAKPPEWLMPHFRASIELLHDYCAPPMPAAAIRDMKVNIIWAGECAFDGVRYPKLPPAMMVGEDTEGMKFLTERRKDFGPGEWAELFPGAHITASTVQGEHHFSMMRDQGAKRLAEFVRAGMRAA
ncbi:Polyketide synthase CTB1 [Pseudocercospora fuligena]|uniref:Polyketide synthase CTB1 n=1 Tax=Pseudocercospora fuligena TaxID=685502 RepID=A0A8H6VN73_9PEZI|nr:Polyketide synthase CTB1 [Pseudocercospora fuligena]